MTRIYRNLSFLFAKLAFAAMAGFSADNKVDPALNMTACEGDIDTRLTLVTLATRALVTLADKVEQVNQHAGFPTSLGRLNGDTLKLNDQKSE